MRKNNFQVVRISLFILTILAFPVGRASASCPVPLAGQFSLTYNGGTKYMTGCKFGDSYRNLCGNIAGACAGSQEGDLEYNDAGNVLRYCNGSNWVNIQCETLTSCADVTAGTITADAIQMKYCNGTTWQAMYNDGICTGIGVQEALFTPTAATEGEDAYWFGRERAIAMTDTYLVVGAHRATIGYIADGAATIYKRSGTTWTRLKELSASPLARFNYFGISVAIDGDYAMSWGMAIPAAERKAATRAMGNPVRRRAAGRSRAQPCCRMAASPRPSPASGRPGNPRRNRTRSPIRACRDSTPNP